VQAIPNVCCDSHIETCQCILSNESVQVCLRKLPESIIFMKYRAMNKKHEGKLKLSYRRTSKSVFIVQVSNSLELLQKCLVYNYSSLKQYFIAYLLIKVKSAVTKHRKTWTNLVSNRSAINTL